MNKKVFVFFIILLSTTVFPQSLKIGLGGGAAIVQQSGFASNTDFENEIDLDNSYQIGGRIKVGFLIPFNLVGEVNYYKLKGDGTTSLPPESSFSGPNTVSMETPMWNVVVGGEYELIPGPLAPHLNLDLIYTSFGESTFTSVISDAYNFKADGQSRFGLGLGAGVDLKMFPGFDLGVNAKYNFHTLFGKEDGEENLNTITLTASILFDVL